MARYRKKTLGKAKINLMELIEMCQEKKTVPSDLDKVFIIGLDYKVKKNGKIKHLRIVFTTLRLLELAKKNNLIAADGTYKLVWQGHPCLLSGTVDMCKKFHPFVFMVTKREKAKDYAFMFKSIIDALKTIYEFDYEPDTLLGDYAQAITNGFTIAWNREPEYRIICWAHCLRKFDEYIFPVKTETTKKKVYDDLYLLQSSQSYEIFQEGRRLFLKKWASNKTVSTCLKSFFKVWGKLETENWYEGYHPLGCVPSTDNALESTNNVVKTKGTLRKRLPIGQFVRSVEDKVLKDFSTNRKPTIIKDGQEIENVNYVKRIKRMF